MGTEQHSVRAVVQPLIPLIRSQPCFTNDSCLDSRRGLRPRLDRSLDSYLTIQPKQTLGGVLVGRQSDGVETHKHLDRSGEDRLVPKAGLYKGGLLKSLIGAAIPSYPLMIA